MDTEILIILVTSLCNGGIVFLFQACVKARNKKKDANFEYKKAVIKPYCTMLHEIYQIFHVDMELLLSPYGCDDKKIIDTTIKVYEQMLKLDAYYDIYKCIIDEKDCVKECQQKIHRWLYESIKPAMDCGTEEEILNAFVTVYNDIQPVLIEEAQVMTKQILAK